ncbi:MAG: amidohydrolase [Proteobacteria bacterium]|nr:amidohydrolase [Pseudomonadota bacterium]
MRCFRPPGGAPRVVAPELPTPLLDAHTHVYSRQLVRQVNGRLGRSEFTEFTAAQLVERLDRQGIQRAIVISGAYLAAADVYPNALPPKEELAATRRENDFAAAEVSGWSDRLILFCSVNPKRPWAADEAARCQRELGARGLKLHFWNSLVDPQEASHRTALRAVLIRAEALDLPVLLHAYNGQLTHFGAPQIDCVVADTLQACPELRVCFAHVGGAGGFDPSVEEAFERLTTLAARPAFAQRSWVDLAAVAFARRTRSYERSSVAQLSRLARLLARWAPDRILWGSDNIEDYLAQTAAVWPLAPEVWRTIAQSDGHHFVTRATR